MAHAHAVHDFWERQLILRLAFARRDNTFVNDFLRLFIPLVFGLLTFVPFTIYIQHSDILSLQEGYAGFFHIDLNQLDGMNGTFTPAHLWFILFLFVFSLVGLPIFQWLRSEKGKRIIKDWEQRCRLP